LVIDHLLAPEAFHPEEAEYKSEELALEHCRHPRFQEEDHPVRLGAKANPAKARYLEADHQEQLDEPDNQDRARYRVAEEGHRYQHTEVLHPKYREVGHPVRLDERGNRVQARCQEVDHPEQ
jgi:hypothetical protein